MVLLDLWSSYTVMLFLFCPAPHCNQLCDWNAFYVDMWSLVQFHDATNIVIASYVIGMHGHFATTSVQATLACRAMPFPAKATAARRSLLLQLAAEFRSVLAHSGPRNAIL